MNARRLWSIPILLACGVLNAQVITIVDYPRYGTALSPAQEQEIQRVARVVTGVLAAGAQVDVAVYGYADSDQGGGPHNELQLSSDRARAAETALRIAVAEEIGRAGLPPHHIDSVATVSLGLGALRPLFPRPASEQQRRANARVDFAWRANAIPPAPPAQPVLERCVRVLATVTEPGPRWRMSCVCNKLLQQGSQVGDAHYDYRARSQLPPSPAWPALAAQQWTVALGNFVHHLRQDIMAAGLGVLNQDFARRLVVLDDAVGRNIDSFRSQPVGDAAAGLLDRAIDYDIRRRMVDPNHTYSCYAGYSRARHDQ